MTVLVAATGCRSPLRLNGVRLVSRGFQVEVVAAVDAARARGLDALLLGSSVHLGHWDSTL